MRTTQQLSITLPVEMAKLVKEKVASGAYASESEVVRDGLRALQERDAVVERWLREEVALTFDAYKEGKVTTSSLGTVKDRLSRHIREQQKSR